MPSVVNPQGLNQQHLLHIRLRGGVLFSLQAICPGKPAGDLTIEKKNKNNPLIGCGVENHELNINYRDLIHFALRRQTRWTESTFLPPNA